MDRLNRQTEKFEAAGAAIHALEKTLTDAMIKGIGNLAGLETMDNVHIIGGVKNAAREGLVSLYVDGMASADVVAKLMPVSAPICARQTITQAIFLTRLG